MFQEGKSALASKVLYLIILLVIALVVFLAVYVTRSLGGPAVLQNVTGPEPIEVEDFLELTMEDKLKVFADNLVGGGPPKDGIPSIDEPEFLSVEDAEKEVDDTDKVFISTLNGEVHIYPQEVLVWHEITNHKIAGEQVTVSYCPLTGTVMGIKGQIGLRPATEFGVSGKLVNSNLVMYDRESESYWPQILRFAVTGDRIGETNDMFSLVWTTWDLAKVKYPEAKVMSRNTGFLRNYGKDPYGSYQKKNTYYDSGKTLFPLLNEDDRLPPKEVVVGVYAVDGVRAAFLKSAVKEQGSIEAEIGGEMMTAIYDESLDTVYVYIGDQETGYQAEFMDAMWFAWAAYFPETELITE